MEVMTVIPNRFRECLLKNDIEGLSDLFKYSKELITNDLGFITVICYIIVVAAMGMACFILYFLYKYRKNPYIKVFSPAYLKITLLGILLSTLKVLQYLPPFFSFKTRIIYLIETLSNILIYFPFIIVIYRIRTILKGETIDMDYINLKFLNFCLLSIVGIFVMSRLLVVSFCDFYYISFGDILQSRLPKFAVGSPEFLNIIYKIYFYVTYIIIFILLIDICSKAKKVKDVSYLFAIFIINVSNNIVDSLFVKLSYDYLRIFLTIIVLHHCLIHMICVYYLAGSRISTIMRYFNNSNGKEVMELSTHSIRSYIPMSSKKFIERKEYFLELFLCADTKTYGISKEFIEQTVN